MADENYTAISVLLDRSGSMRSIRTDAEGGLRTFLEDQRQLPGSATLRLVQFDHEYELVHSSLSLDQVPEPVLQPRGTTALLDAWGIAMTAFGEELAALSEAQRPAHVLFVVVTDGLENASREWTREQVLAKVREQTEQWGWTFLFLASNQDAVAEGEKYGVPAGQSVTYANTSRGTTAAFDAASAAVTRTRGGGSAGFTAAERRESGP